MDVWVCGQPGLQRQVWEQLSLGSEGNHQKQKVDEDVIERSEFKVNMVYRSSFRTVWLRQWRKPLKTESWWRCNWTAPANSITWQLWLCGSGFSIKDRRQGLWNIPSQLRKIIEARHVSGVCLKLWRRNLNYLADSKILKMAELWDTYWGKLLSGSRTSSRKRSVW